MPKEAKEAQEVENDLKVDTDANLRAGEESSEQESAQESNAQTDKNSEKGFFAKAVDKAKEATSELFSTDSTQKESKTTQATQTTPKLKSAISKKTKLIDCLGYQYKGCEDFTLRVGSKVYVITQGEILIVPNGNTSRWLAHKSTLFTPVL